jgi:hypothetical protein
MFNLDTKTNVNTVDRGYASEIKDYLLFFVGLGVCFISFLSTFFIVTSDDVDMDTAMLFTLAFFVALLHIPTVYCAWKSGSIFFTPEYKNKSNGFLAAAIILVVMVDLFEHILFESTFVLFTGSALMLGVILIYIGSKTLFWQEYRKTEKATKEMDMYSEYLNQYRILLSKIYQKKAYYQLLASKYDGTLKQTQILVEQVIVEEKVNSDGTPYIAPPVAASAPMLTPDQQLEAELLGEIETAPAPAPATASGASFVTSVSKDGTANQASAPVQTPATQPTPAVAAQIQPTAQEVVPDQTLPDQAQAQAPVATEAPVEAQAPVASEPAPAEPAPAEPALDVPAAPPAMLAP